MQLRCATTVFLLGSAAVLVGGRPQAGEGCGMDREGRQRLVGDSWSPDGCNNCRCLPSGTPGCTRRICTEQESWEEGRTCSEGKTWEEKTGEDLKVCTCSKGSPSCTDKVTKAATSTAQCGEDSEGNPRRIGDSWKEECNNCRCTSTGVPVCTLRFCVNRQEHECVDERGNRRQHLETWEEWSEAWGQEEGEESGIEVTGDINDCSCNNGEVSCQLRELEEDQTGSILASPARSLSGDGVQCVDMDGATREEGESWAEDCNSCMCTQSGSSCTKRLCSFDLGLPCTDEQNITRQHSESWMMVPPPPEEIKEVAEVQLVWLSDLSMEIQLDENKTDVILLAPTSNIPGEETPCLFSGKVGKDLDSLVTVSGCRGDDEVAVSIASRRLPGGFADLTISEGTTYEVSFEGLFFEGSRCTCADGEISCAVELPPAPPQVPTDPLMDSAPRLPSAQASAPRLPSAPKVHFPTDEAQQRKTDFKSTSGSTSSLLIVVEESSDKVQCNQAGVTRCRGVITSGILRSLQAGATMELVADEGVLMTLRRDPEVTTSGGVSLAFLLSDGGEGNIVVGTNGAMFGSIKPLTGSVHYTLQSCGEQCSVLMERPSDWFNQFQD